MKNKNLKKLLAVVLMLAMAVQIMACGSSGGSSEGEATDASAEETQSSGDDAQDTASAGDSKGVIAYSCYNMSWEYYVTLAQGVKEAAEAAGYEYVEHDQQSDQSLMIQGCTDLLNQDIACLVLTPCKPEAAASIYELAEEKGIPVVLADISTEATGYLACLKSDNYDGGVLAGNYVLDNLTDAQSKKAAMITVDPSNTNIVRSDGFKDTVEAGGWTVVSELSGQSEPDVAYSCMQDIITANPDVEVVFCSNDPMAISASQAVADAGLTPGEDVKVIGYDAQSNVFEPIENGTVLGTVAQDPYGMGSGAVECFLKNLDGEELTFDDEETKTIYTDQWIIDASNVAEYK
ncbi:MAG: substrate-binding domain-containing protein [Ruminococcus sp.]|jgi:ribose transport system substrate-binding protein